MALTLKATYLRIVYFVVSTTFLILAICAPEFDS